MGKYDDMLDMPRHISLSHPPMSIENRAAQFASFAALSGYEDDIKDEEERYVSRQTEHENPGNNI